MHADAEGLGAFFLSGPIQRIHNQTPGVGVLQQGSDEEVVVATDSDYTPGLPSASRHSRAAYISLASEGCADDHREGLGTINAQRTRGRCGDLGHAVEQGVQVVTASQTW